MKIIAESAFNHNGNLDYLKELAYEADKAGAEYFTVQIMDVDSFCTLDYSKYELYKKHTLTFQEWEEYFRYCDTLKIQQIPCVLDEPSLDFALKQGFNFLKIHATDLTNAHLLKKLSELTGIRLIVETQCATTQDIDFGLKYLNDKVVCLMHGFSDYPTEVENMNLESLEYLKEYYPNYSIGFADHSLDTMAIPLMAMAKGCSFLEKHITLTRNNRNFDWQVSLYPNEFSVLVENVSHYQNALGSIMKHPKPDELKYRDVMYKKVIKSGTDLEFKRSDTGKDYLTHMIDSFDTNNVGISIISRLKSKRLPEKVLKPFHESFMEDFLYKRVSKSKVVNSVILSTSWLEEDHRLVEKALAEEQVVFKGHPVSVIDRMLSLAINEEFGAIFRVTGDNPFTDPELIDEMVKLLLENDLDYVRANNLPFGLSAELFSTSYLWRLYLNMENPMHSEYLTLYVLEDKKANKGCLDIVTDVENFKYINLSVDYPNDYKRACSLLDEVLKSGMNPYTVTIPDISPFLDKMEREPKDKIVKLPAGDSVSFETFLDRLSNQNYKIRKEITL